MRVLQGVCYALDFGRKPSQPIATDWHVGRSADAKVGPPIPRIARLMALAIRLEGLLRDGTIGDYAELARVGHVTRPRLTQIMKLLDLAPDIQEHILFLPPIKNLNERNLRPIVNVIDWRQQRRLFHSLTKGYLREESNRWLVSRRR